MYTGSFQFTQLEQSPHARTAGRAFYHGSWGRPDPPKGTSAGESDSSSTSSSSEGSGSPAGRGPEIEGGSSEEDWEEGTEEAAFGLDGTVERDAGDVGTVTRAKKEPKRRFAWGWPKKKEEEERKTKKRRRENTYSDGEYVDDPGTKNDGASGFGDSSDDGGDGPGGKTELKKMANKDRAEKKKRKKNKKKTKKQKQKHRGKETSKPHGEGYVEFLDGWGVSQVGTYRKLDRWFARG